MLSEKSAETVRATLPAVSSAIGEIASVFYDKLFTAHPGLLRDLFNRGNRANGAQQQALADPGGGVAFRADLDQLVAKLPNATAHVWYEGPEGPWPANRTGLVDLTAISIPEGVTAYLCGPLPFLRAARAQLRELGVPAADIHYEVFGPDLWLGQA
ncbi:hypothetical protein [Saccharopolyspora pogona]|uniref:hypothetical protein n=1 Tax=Saccharopolyspora pogona TaxID=333966 RepID=UPI0016858CB3|nr:hypothetical protein [Saccharopolyspora pogona]